MHSVPTLAQRLQRFPLHRADTPEGAVMYRQAGAATRPVSHVLLHGIGSGSANWLAQLEAAEAGNRRVLAWEAPGYGGSAPIEPAMPVARDYARRLWAWLDAMNVTAPVTLVGHSLGALMATCAAEQQSARVARLVLLSPAQGYARSSAAERGQKLADRLTNLQSLGPQRMAERRAAAMLSPQADPALVAFVQASMAQIQPAGYTQAAHLLAQGDLLADLSRTACPVAVASGSADVITPPAGCQQVARAAGVDWIDLGPVGHACPLEAADAVHRLIAPPVMETL